MNLEASVYFAAPRRPRLELACLSGIALALALGAACGGWLGGPWPPAACLLLAAVSGIVVTLVEGVPGRDLARVLPAYVLGMIAMVAATLGYLRGAGRVFVLELAVPLGIASAVCVLARLALQLAAVGRRGRSRPSALELAAGALVALLPLAAFAASAALSHPSVAAPGRAGGDVVEVRVDPAGRLESDGRVFARASAPAFCAAVAQLRPGTTLRVRTAGFVSLEASRSLGALADAALDAGLPVVTDAD
jgi:hypothetical protein